jgi:hypothetical protein
MHASGDIYHLSFIIFKSVEALAKVHYPLTLALSHQGRGLINKPLP